MFSEAGCWWCCLENDGAICLSVPFFRSPMTGFQHKLLEALVWTSRSSIQKKMTPTAVKWCNWQVVIWIRWWTNKHLAPLPWVAGRNWYWWSPPLNSWRESRLFSEKVASHFVGNRKILQVQVRRRFRTITMQSPDLNGSTAMCCWPRYVTQWQAWSSS